MRVLLITPSFAPAIGGNARTASRWAAGLSARGVDVSMADMANDPGGRRLIATARAFAPDLLHAHHAWKAGRWLTAADPEGRRPWVVSFAGTDLLALEKGDGTSEQIRGVCRRAARFVVQGRDAQRRLTAAAPEWASRVVYVSKGVWLDDEAYPLRREAGVAEDEVLFLLPGGVRRVKGQLAIVRAFARLRQAVPEARARLVLAGPVIEADYAARVARAGEACGARRVEVPPAAMGGAYREADVVVNASEAEGFSNALLEAMAAGRAVLASRIGANVEAVEEGRTGLLFSGEEEFVARAAALARDPALRRRLGEAAARAIAARYDPAAEAAALAAVYAEALGEKKRAPA